MAVAVGRESSLVKKLTSLCNSVDMPTASLLQQMLQKVAEDRKADAAGLLLREGPDIYLDNAASRQLQQGIYEQAPHWLKDVAAEGPGTYPLGDAITWIVTLPLHSPFPVAALTLQGMPEPPSDAWLNAVAPLFTSLLYEVLRRGQLEGQTFWPPTISTVMTELRKMIIHLLQADECTILYQDPTEETSPPPMLAPGRCRQLLTQFQTQPLPTENLHIPDTGASDQTLAQTARDQGYGTILMLPIQQDESTSGVLVVCRRKVRPFTKKEQNQGQTLAKQVGRLLRNVTLLQKEPPQRQMIEVLASAAKVLTQSKALDDVLDQILAQLALVVPHDASNVMLIDEETEQVEVVRWRGYETFGVENPKADLSLPLDTPSFQQIMATGDPLLVQDTRTDPTWIVREITAWQHSYIGAPIIIEGEVVGFVNVGSSHPDYFTLRDARTLGTFATYVALALRNARSYERNQRRQRYLEHVAAIITTINHTPDLQEVLKFGLERTLQMSEMQRGAIYLWNPTSNRIELRVHQAYPKALLTQIQRQYPDQGNIGRAFSERETIMSSEKIQTAEGESQPGFSINAPLLAERQAIGVLRLEQPGTQPPEGDVLPYLRTIANQLALAVKRAELSHQLRQQVQALQYLYEASAGLMTQTEHTGAVFILLRTLYDTLPNTVSTALYTNDGGAWRRIKVYARRAVVSRPIWQEGAPGDGEENFLDACQRQRVPVIVSERRDSLPDFWQQIYRSGVRQLLYYPLSLPTGEFFGVVAIALSDAQHMAPQNAALIQALIQQGTAAMTRIRLYEKSRKEESRLRAILGSSRDGIFLVGEDQVIHYVNEQALSLLALPGRCSDWEGRAFEDVTTAIYDDVLELSEWFRYHTRPGWADDDERSQNSVTFETPEGRALTPYRWPVYSQQETLMGALFLIRDVTEQQALERMRDDLLHMVVHDMRNPLSIIINALHLLEDPNMTEMAGEVSRMAKDNAKRMLTLINAILDINKIESGQFVIHQKAVQLSAVLDFADHHLLVSGKDLKLELDIPDTLPLAYVDPDVIQRIFQNLVDNAFKFVQETHGLIRIEARQQEEWIEVEVFNNGPRIPETLRNQLFQKFAVSDHPNQGYGLGLAFCRLAVQAHGGEIWAENQENGVSFFFTVPVAET